MFEHAGIISKSGGLRLMDSFDFQPSFSVRTGKAMTRPTQGATPRCQGSAEAAAMPALRQAHQGRQPARI
jgi:hypothetical protein